MPHSISDNISLETLPTIPHTLLELIRISEQPSVEIEDLALIIRQDPIICARVFKLAHSACFRQWNKISDVEQLLVVIGIEPVFQIALLCATEQIFTQMDNQLALPVSTLWYRSVFCANVAEQIATLVGFESSHEVYLAGLLHRIGQWTLLSNFTKRYLDKIDITLELRKAENIEHCLFKVTSSKIGARVIQDWQVAPQVCSFIANAVEFQTRPPDSLLKSTLLTRILALSTILCDAENVQSAEVIYAGIQLFGLNNAIIQQVVDRARKQTDSIIFRFAPQNEKGSPASGPELLKRSQAQQQRSLRLQIKNHALLNAGKAPHLNINHGVIHKILHQLRLDFHLLFGVQDLCFLVPGEKPDSLCGYDDLGTRPELHQISISREHEFSMILKAFREDKIYYNSDEQKSALSVPELQLENLLGNKSMCFIPMRSGSHKMGVIIVPLSLYQWRRLSSTPSLLQLAGQAAGNILNSAEEYRQYKKQKQEELEFNLRAATHEINNPLSIINNYLYLLPQQLDKEKAKEQIEIIQEEIGRVGTLVSGLKDLNTTEQSHGKSQIQINELIYKLHSLLQSTLFKPRQLKLNLNLDENIEPIESISSNLKQVLINLLKNASEILPSYGEVWITTTNRVYKNQRQYVEIEIKDNGPGIDKEILENIFLPGRSTKKGHAGLGLSIVKHLLDEIDGEISCSSSESGTRFQIFLPRSLTSTI